MTLQRPPDTILPRLFEPEDGSRSSEFFNISWGYTVHSDSDWRTQQSLEREVLAGFPGRRWSLFFKSRYLLPLITFFPRWWPDGIPAFAPGQSLSPKAFTIWNWSKDNRGLWATFFHRFDVGIPGIHGYRFDRAFFAPSQRNQVLLQGFIFSFFPHLRRYVQSPNWAWRWDTDAVSWPQSHQRPEAEGFFHSLREPSLEMFFVNGFDRFQSRWRCLAISLMVRYGHRERNILCQPLVRFPGSTKSILQWHDHTVDISRFGIVWSGVVSAFKQLRSLTIRSW